MMLEVVYWLLFLSERLKQTQATCTEPTVGRYDKIDAREIKALKTAVGKLRRHAFTFDTNISANCSLALK